MFPFLLRVQCVGSDLTTQSTLPTTVTWTDRLVGATSLGKVEATMESG